MHSTIRLVLERTVHKRHASGIIPPADGFIFCSSDHDINMIAFVFLVCQLAGVFLFI